MNRLREIELMHKIASKAGKKRASGLNWSAAESVLSSETPDIQLSREQIKQQIAENPMFSEADLSSILNLSIEDHHAKMLNKQEIVFIEIGAFLAKATDQLSEVGDYLQGKDTAPGNLSGGRPAAEGWWKDHKYSVSLDDLDAAKAEFLKLNAAQVAWHREGAAAQSAEVQAEGEFGNGYMTNEVVAEYEDGWKVVYVPAADEGPNYQGNSDKSNDRTTEGNLNGLCLGSSQGLYQDNASGKIYSVRDSSNKPHVTIRIGNNQLMEAKGKSNLPPSIDGASIADEWLESQRGLNYKHNQDYQAFPPLDQDDAVAAFHSNPDEMYKKGWISSWYDQGIQELDEDVLRRIAAKDIYIVYSGLGKKYKELVASVIKHWTDNYVADFDSAIFANLNPRNIYEISHESWKTYKKDPWMQTAVKKLMLESANFGFKIGIQQIPQYDVYARPAAKSMVERDPSSFFEYKFQKTYPELESVAAKSMAERDPNSFFELKFQEIYPELAPLAAKNMAERYPDEFLSYKLLEIYPELAPLAAKNMAERDPESFFYRKLQETYPGFAPLAAKSIAERDPDEFFSYKFQEIYPELAPLVAKNLVEEDPVKFFYRKLQETYPELGSLAAKSMAERGPNEFFYYKLQETYPELAPLAAKNLVEEDPEGFFSYKLQETYPELTPLAAKNLVEEDPEGFFSYKLQETYPELFLSRHLASLQAWLIKNNFKKEAGQIASLR
jgi:hypothetical protein